LAATIGEGPTTNKRPAELAWSATGDDGATRSITKVAISRCVPKLGSIEIYRKTGIATDQVIWEKPLVAAQNFLSE
jgi:hypothetical protein